MELSMTVIVITIIAIIVIGVIVYYYFSSTSVSATYTLTYEGNVLSKGSSAPVFSSDGEDRIVFTRDSSPGNTAGIYMYNTTEKTSTLISTKKAKGLAYDGSDFMMIDEDGTLYRINQDNTIVEPDNANTGYTALYDTVDGYYLASGSDYSVTGESGSTTKNTGNYGLITLVLKRSASA
jgi:hypothetical protein